MRLFITLLSALLFNAAWLDFYSSWLVIPSFLLLFILFKKIDRPACVYGFVWGVIVFCFHFHWLAQSLIKHGSCSMLLTGALLFPLIMYCSFLTGMWFFAMQWVSRWTRVLIIPVSVVFWYLFDAYGLVPFGMGMGYPFINPLLPLVRYRCFLAALSFFIGSVPVSHDTTELVKRLHFVPPVVNRAWCYGEAWTGCPYAVVHRLHKQILRGVEHNAVLVSPESTVLFFLNKHEALIKTLCPAKSDQLTYILGSLRQNNDRIEQVAYCLQSGLIIKTYVKKILVPFAEQTPPAWQWLQGLRRRLSSGYAECVAGDNNTAADEHFYIAECSVRPALCLEFFEQPVRALCSARTDAIMALVNDSWYTPLFREWLFLLAVLKSHVSGLLVVYIGHFGCYTIEPKNHSITQARSCYASLHA